MFAQRYFNLFAVLLIFFVLNPFLAQTRFGMYLFGGLFTLVILLCVYAIKHHKKLIYTALALAAIVICGHWLISIIQPNKPYYLIDYIITIIFLALITFSVLQYVYSERKINADTIYGSICAYLLIGLVWSFVYMITYLLNADAFSLPHDQSLPNLLSHNFIYYSFVTLSTLGYGDIVPLSATAKTFSWLEAVTGQIYLTVLIARLIGLHISQQQRNG